MKDKNGIANLSKNLQLKLKAFDTTNKKTLRLVSISRGKNLPNFFAIQHLFYH